MIFLTEVIESGLFKGMTKHDATAMIATLIFILIILLVPFTFWIKDKIDEYFYITYQPEDKVIEYDKFIGFPCPCCRSSNITLITTIKFSKISSYKKKINFYENSTELSYKIKCSDCGIQTEANKDINTVILDWNGKSQSTEIIKKE